MRIRVSGKDKNDIIHIIEIIVLIQCNIIFIQFGYMKSDTFQGILYLLHCHSSYKMFHK